MSIKILIHAPNIHGGGGEVLLNSIIDNIDPSHDVAFNVHPKFIGKSDNCNIIKSNILSRVIIEYKNIQRSKFYNYILYFGNLPPIFKLNCPAVVFIQNKYLVDSIPTRELPLRISLRLFFERALLRIFKDNAQFYIVQSDSMKDLLRSVIGENKKIVVLPFYSTSKAIIKKSNTVNKKNSTFIYVATDEPHKNHKRLIEAWYLLSRFNIRPTLNLTISNDYLDKILNNLSDKYGNLSLNIINHGYTSYDKIHKLYNKIDVLIYPSLHESFGLPIIEAIQHNLDIIASELDFVRDLVDPEETFNPESSKSIFLAVTRYMKLDYRVNNLIDSKNILNHINKHIL
jgi:glycosyltransferase involved in cell wall biosynthesis